MNSKRRYIYVDSSSGTATSSIPYQSPSPQEALRGRYGNNDCYTFPMTKPSSVGLSEACYYRYVPTMGEVNGPRRVRRPAGGFERGVAHHFVLVPCV